MTVKSGQTAAGAFATVDGTGKLTAATGTPVGALYVDGVANGAAVTVTGANPYKWAVTLPALTAGQVVQMYVTATVSTIATGGMVWADTADTSLPSDVAATIGVAGAGLTAIPSLPAVAPGTNGGLPTVSASGHLTQPVYAGGYRAWTGSQWVTSAILADMVPAGQGGLTTITLGGTGWTSYVGMVLFCGGLYDAYRIISATDTTITLDHALDAFNVGSAYFVLPYYDDLAARTAAVTNLDTTISSRAAATTALSNTTLPDSVPADGTRPTPEQALYAIYCYLMERAVSGTTVTVKKVDGSTSLMTFTINDASAPTSITRTT